MPKQQVKIQRPKKKNKDWSATFMSKKTGRKRVLHGGDGKKNEREKSKLGQKSFMKRHGNKSPVQQINKKIWDGSAGIGSTVTIDV